MGPPLSIRREIACKLRKKKKTSAFNQGKSIVFPHALSFQDAKCRKTLLNAINKIRYPQEVKSDEPLYLDFNKVGLLIAPATIYFSHVLEQFPTQKILSRASNTSNIEEQCSLNLGYMNVLDYSRVIPITTWLTGLHLVEQI